MTVAGADAAAASASTGTTAADSQHAMEIRSSDATTANVSHVRSFNAIEMKDPPTMNAVIDAISPFP